MKRRSSLLKSGGKYHSTEVYLSSGKDHIRQKILSGDFHPCEKGGVPDGKRQKQEAQQERLSLRKKETVRKEETKSRKKENRKSVREEQERDLGNRKAFLQLHSRVFRIFGCCRMVSAR